MPNESAPRCELRIRDKGAAPWRCLWFFHDAQRSILRYEDTSGGPTWLSLLPANVAAILVADFRG